MLPYEDRQKAHRRSLRKMVCYKTLSIDCFVFIPKQASHKHMQEMQIA